MPELTPGLALRQLDQAQAAMKKVRQAMRTARQADADPEHVRSVFRAGLAAQAQAFRVLCEITEDVATDDVLTRQIAVQRYATAMAVRLRRLIRKGPGALGDDDEGDGDDES
jgi:uncharacterized membrane protein YdfJ with MMPL/SSD domain